MNYFTTVQINQEYTTTSDFNTTLLSYVSSEDARTILEKYVQLANLSPVATSGLYNDLTSKIDGIYEFEFDDLKETISKNYVLITESDYELNQYFDEFVEEILDNMEDNYTDIATIDDDIYLATINTKSQLKNIISTDYQTPDTSEFLTSEVISANFVDHTEVGISRDAYIQSMNLSTVSATAEFDDLLGTPDISEYITSQNAALNLVTDEFFIATMNNYLKKDGEFSVDLDPYELMISVNSYLEEYSNIDTIKDIALSGSFNDLFNTENILMKDELDNRLSNVLLITDLNTATGNMDSKFYDSIELASVTQIL